MDRTPKRDFRFPAGLPSTCVISGRVYECSAHNLSRSGVLLVGALPPPPDERLDITLKSPIGNVSVTIAARVTRVEDTDEAGIVQVGLAFDALTAAERDGIEILVSRILEAQAPGPLETLRPDASVPEMRKALDAVPIPHRIALAARASPREREILRNDTHPAVLESLARNPNLNIAEARLLVQSHFLTPATLETLAHDPRWARDDEIRLSVASHPKVPLAVGERLVQEMPVAVLRRLLQRPGLNAVLREKIVKRLARG